jgi:hypothetical protein
VHSGTLGAEKHLSSKDSGAFLLVLFIGAFYWRFLLALCDGAL